MSKRDTFFAALDAATRAGPARGPHDALIMGVCNVTPDSFSDGGRYLGTEAARRQIDRLIDEGAGVIDIGGESTRPGAKPVSDDDQLRRVLPALEHAISRGAVVSVDTQSALVADAALTAGAHAVNDVSCLRDEALADIVARHQAAYVLMHARGTQEEMAGFSRYPDDAYADVVSDVVREWSAAAHRAVARGVSRGALVMDPGFGFAKNVRHSAELLARLAEVVRQVDVPVLIGVSRKSFLTLASEPGPGPALGDRKVAPADRLGASIAGALHGVRAGARVVRVHDVRATRQALELECAMRALVAAGSASAKPERTPVPVLRSPSGLPS